MGFWDDIKKGFSKVGNFVGKGAKEVWKGVKSVGKPVFEAGKGLLKTGTESIKKLAGTGTDLAGSLGKSAGDFAGGMSKMPTYIMYGGLALVGGIILFSLMNPKETTQMVTTGINTAGQVAQRVPIIP